MKRLGSYEWQSRINDLIQERNSTKKLPRKIYQGQTIVVISEILFLVDIVLGVVLFSPLLLQGRGKQGVSLPFDKSVKKSDREGPGRNETTAMCLGS